MNRHFKFWLTFLNIYLFIISIIVILNIEYKIYILLVLQALVFIIAQFIINYTNLTEEDK